MAEGLRRIAFWLILAPATILLLVFALANRQRVFLSLAPFGGIELPLFMIFFLSVIAGALVGGFIVWNTQRPWRALARRQEREIDELREENTRLKASAQPLQPKQDWPILPPF